MSQTFVENPIFVEKVSPIYCWNQNHRSENADVESQKKMISRQYAIFSIKETNVKWEILYETVNTKEQIDK